jgi:hypothetical protein
VTGVMPGSPPPNWPPMTFSDGAENATIVCWRSCAAVTRAIAPVAMRGVRPGTPATVPPPIEPDTSRASSQRLPVGSTFWNVA